MSGVLTSPDDVPDKLPLVTCGDADVAGGSLTPSMWNNKSSWSLAAGAVLGPEINRY